MTVTVLTDGADGQQPVGTEVVPSVRLTKAGNRELEYRLRELEPDVCLWNFGLTSALHLDPSRIVWRSYALFTSPVYTLRELADVGPGALVRARDHALVHIAGACTPSTVVRSALAPFDGVIVQSQHTERSLTSMGISARHIHLIPPGIDDVMRQPLPMPENGDPFNVLYLGSPLPIRGAHDLVRAIAHLPDDRAHVRVRVLARGRGEYRRHEAELQRLVGSMHLADRVSIRSGILSSSELRAELTDAHLVALPFQLIPSDAPIAVLEAMAQGRPILGTSVASLTEYLEGGRGFIAQPARPASIARAIVDATRSQGELSEARRLALLFSTRFLRWAEVVARVARVVDPTSAEAA